jgi:FkbM family methyltransferase
MCDDPIHHHVCDSDWRGVLVEPLPDVFERLKLNYAGRGDRLEFVNAAVAGHDGEVDFCRHALLPVCSGLTIRTRLQRRAQRQNAIEQIRVPCMTVKTLFSRHVGDRELDLLLVDVEGHDAEVVKAVDYRLVSAPRIVCYEHKHLSPEAQDGVVKLLRGYGYTVTGDDVNNTLAFRA